MTINFTETKKTPESRKSECTKPVVNTAKPNYIKVIEITKIDPVSKCLNINITL